MLDHFQLHKSETRQDISFVEFLSMHYDLKTAHEDPVHESELPFQAQYGNQLVFLSDGIDFKAESQITILKKFPSAYLANYEFLYHSSILHPPKA